MEIELPEPDGFLEHGAIGTFLSYTRTTFNPQEALYTETKVREAIAVAVAKEREACAEVCDTVATKMQSHKNGFALSQPVKDNLTGHIDGAKTCAADIRARGETPCS